MRDGSGRAEAEEGGPGAEVPVRGSTADAAYRGFLFADLRGFTAFVELHGEKAAADLLDAYRALVREQVAKLDGAEVRTEGDSFYLVFPSARSAVACSLEITAAAARHLELHPDQPIRVGIGINAGEATQRGDGFVGTAVNLAARVCSQARAGEVLVTGTVREAVRGNADLRFTARGNPRLKGIAESVPLFAVEGLAGVAGRAAPGWRGTRRWGRAVAIAGTITAAVALAGGAAVIGGWLRDAGGGSSVASPLATASHAPSAQAGDAPTSPAASTNAQSVSEFPNQEELDLLASVGLDEDYCDRANLDDRPRLTIDAANAEHFGTGTTRPQLAVSSGVSCTIPSAAAPSSVMYWVATQIFGSRARDVPDAVIQSEAGTFGVPNGDCGVAAPAVGRWSFGGSEGWLLCRELYGDAVLVWTYDGQPIVGVASRRDGDHAKLYAWWRDNARFLTD
jgi:class 3 adenylate cyclase